MEAKVANMRYKPFAGLPPQASEKVTFNCMGKVKENPHRNGQHRRTSNLCWFLIGYPLPLLAYLING